MDGSVEWGGVTLRVTLYTVINRHKHSGTVPIQCASRSISVVAEVVASDFHPCPVPRNSSGAPNYRYARSAGSHRPISFLRIKQTTRERSSDIFFFVKLSITKHIVGLVHKHYIINEMQNKHVQRTCLVYHTACKVEFQPFNRSHSQLTFFNLKTFMKSTCIDYTWYVGTQQPEVLALIV